MIEFLKGLLWPPYAVRRRREAFNAGWEVGRSKSPVGPGEVVWVPAQHSPYVGSYGRGLYCGNQGLSNPYHSTQRGP